MSPIRLGSAAAAIALAAGFATQAHATLALTAAGIADGFTLTTFATLNPSYAGTFNYGPFGVAYAGGGNVIVSNYADGNIYSFADSDGQTPGSALNIVPGRATSVVAMASAGGHAYGEDPANGLFAEYNSDGTINHDLTGVAATTDLGMAGNPVTGHILASSSAGLIDIDPLANGGLGSFTVVNGGGDGDGVSVSPDGLTVYSEQGCINGYTIATGALVSSACGFNSPDGTGVISGGAFNGDLIVNNNSGEIDLYDFTSNTITDIADGGTRGDYTSADPTNGTLFLDYSDIVARLGIAGGSIGGGPAAPEPASLALFGAGLAGLAFALRRKRA